MEDCLGRVMREVLKFGDTHTKKKNPAAVHPLFYIEAYHHFFASCSSLMLKKKTLMSTESKHENKTLQTNSLPNQPELKFAITHKELIIKQSRGESTGEAANPSELSVLPEC